MPLTSRLPVCVWVDPSFALALSLSPSGILPRCNFLFCLTSLGRSNPADETISYVATIIFGENFFLQKFSTSSKGSFLSVHLWLRTDSISCLPSKIHLLCRYHHPTSKTTRSRSIHGKIVDLDHFKALSEMNVNWSAQKRRKSDENCSGEVEVLPLRNQKQNEKYIYSSWQLSALEELHEKSGSIDV